MFETCEVFYVICFEIQRADRYGWGFNLFLVSNSCNQVMQAMTINATSMYMFCFCGLSKYEVMRFWKDLGLLVYCRYLVLHCNIWDAWLAFVVFQFFKKICCWFVRDTEQNNSNPMISLATLGTISCFTSPLWWQSFLIRGYFITCCVTKD